MNDNNNIFRLLSPVLGEWRRAVALIEAGIDPNMRDDTGEPLLSHAARSGAWEAFSALITAGAAPLAASNEGVTAFHHALAGMLRPNRKYWSQRQIRGCKQMVTYYVEHGRLGTVATAMLAMATNKLAPFRALLGKDLDPDTRVEDPLRVLLLPNPKKYLAAAIEDHNRRARGEGFPSPPTLLMWAAGLGRTKFVELLVGCGADQDARDDLGYRAADYTEIYRAGQVPGVIE